MPIFEYECCDCGRVFEEIVFGSGKGVRCPDCESGKVTKLISAPCAAPGDKGAAGCGKSGFS